MVVVDWTPYTDDELNQANKELSEEMQRRQVLSTAQDNIRVENEKYLNAAGRTTGQPWTQPTGAHDSYPINWTVTHNGKAWTSLVFGNVYEPGVANWREGSDEEWPAWVQPSGSQDSYPLGAQVSHIDKHWTSTIAANVWEPGSSGAESLWAEES